MSVPGASPKKVHFGDFVIDLSTGELSHNSDKIILLGQPFQILAILLERPGELVTRDDLKKRLWSPDTFVDFDHSLNKAVNRLREALADSAETPRYIETFPRRGYRFIGVVDKPAPAVTLPKIPVWFERHSPRGNWKGLSLLIALLSITSIFGYLAPSLWQTKKGQPPAQIVRVTSSPGYEFEPSLSPDGSQIAFAAMGESGASGGIDIYVKIIGDERTLRLTHPPGNSFCPKWSPDGRTIAYERRVQLRPGVFDRSLFLTNPLGGAKHLIGRVSSDRGCGVSWSPDCKLFAYDDQPPGERSGIFLMPLDGSPGTRLTTSPATMFDRFPAFSRDGKQIAFVRDKDDGGRADIYLFSLARHEEKKVASLDRTVTSLAWTADGKRIIFELGLFFTGDSSLFSVTATGGEAERLQIVSSEAGDPTISWQGDRLAYATTFQDSNIWKYSTKDDTPPSKLVSSTRIDVQPDFSPSGDRVAFVSNRDGASGIWIGNADGTDAVRASRIPGGTPVWSPNGKQIAFDTNERGHSDIVILAADGGKEEFLTNDNSDHITPSWSADGESVYFGSNRTGRWEIWKLSVRSKKASQVTRQGGVYGQESPDAQFLYYQKPAKNSAVSSDLSPEIWRMPLAGGSEELVVRISDPASPMHLSWFWRVTTRGIYFIDNAATPKPLLRFISFPARNVRTLRQLDKPAWGGPGLAVSADGKTVLMGQIDQWGSDIMLVENFR